MSIFGFGAIYGGADDVTSAFLNLGVACSGWGPSTPPSATQSIHNGDAPFVEALLRTVKPGDIAFIKSYSPTAGLRIKGVGIVTDARPHEVEAKAGYPVNSVWAGHQRLGTGIKVRWNWPDLRSGTVFWSIGSLDDRGTNFRTGTIYEELGPDVLPVIIRLLLNPKDRQDSAAVR